MMEGGFIRTFAKDNITDKRNSLALVGYSAKGTLAERLLHSKGLVSIDGEEYRVRCKVDYVEGFSAHADVDALIRYINKASELNKLKAIYLVHGDVTANENVKSILEYNGYTNVIIPVKNYSYKL